MKKSKVGVLLPEKLLRELEAHRSLWFTFDKNRMTYLLSLIVTHRQDSYPGSYSQLNMVHLNKIVPRAHVYLNWLRDNNYIEWINYSAGRNSRLYRFCKLYQGPVVWRTISDQKFILRLQTTYKRLRYLNSKKYPILNGFIHRTKINVPEALKTIELTYEVGCKVDRELADGRRSFSLAEVFKIASGEIYIKCSKNNGRLDTNFTRLPSELVQHLTIDSNPLTEIDITNSQPFFAGCLFDAKPEIISVIGRSLFMLTKKLHLNDKQDVILYRSLVSSGLFYSHMAEQFNMAGLTFTDRGELKKQIFIIFFGKNTAINYSPVVKVFATSFPNVYYLFNQIKKKAHNKLAILLQRIESYVVLEKLAPQLVTNYPTMPFLTKHDSILLSGLQTLKQAEQISQFIAYKVREVTGLQPKLKIKDKHGLGLPDIGIYSINEENNKSNNTSIHYVNQTSVTKRNSIDQNLL
jgi:hypothetical protein